MTKEKFFKLAKECGWKSDYWINRTWEERPLVELDETQLKIIKNENEDALIYEFKISLNEVANCELSPDLINKIMKLEIHNNIADQLEILLEYFHAIEGTDRVTSLA